MWFPFCAYRRPDGGFERQYQFHCTRCMLLIGYEHTPPPLKSGGKFTFIFPGALTYVWSSIFLRADDIRALHRAMRSWIPIHDDSYIYNDLIFYWLATFPTMLYRCMLEQNIPCMPFCNIQTARCGVSHTRCTYPVIKHFHLLWCQSRVVGHGMLGL